MSTAFIETWRLKSSIIISEYFKLATAAELARSSENNSATRIQKVWRGFVARRWLGHLRFMIVRIQRHFRGYIGRREFRVKVLEMNYRNRLGFYCKHAIIVQKTWRGFWFRKNRFCYYTRKAYVQEISKKMDETRDSLERYRQGQILKQEEQVNSQRILRTMKLAGKIHHLKGTKAVPGVLDHRVLYWNSKDYDYQWKKVSRDNVTILGASGISMTEANLDDNMEIKKWIQKTVGRNYRHFKLSNPPPSPPTQKRVQGPFLPSNRLEEKIHAPAHPSLRVATDYNDTKNFKREERRVDIDARISSAPLTVPRFMKHNQPPFSQSCEPYSKSGYRSMSFRRAEEKNGRSFRNVLPPIRYVD